MKTYTPGYLGVKIVATILSLGVLTLGLAELWFPAKLLLEKTTVKATIVRIEKTRSGFKPEIYTTTQPIPSETNRSATFWHYAEFQTSDGRLMTDKINIASQIDPVYKIGEKIRVAYEKTNPQTAVAILDVRTWALGFFVALLGLVFSVISFYFTFYARKPIELPEDTPDEDPGLKVAAQAAAH